MNIYRQLDVSDHELTSSVFTPEAIYRWVMDKLASELHRAAPHGDIEYILERNSKLSLSTIIAVAEWKEPVQ